MDIKKVWITDKIQTFGFYPAQLRQPPVRQRREPERDTGMAWAQRHIHNVEHLHTLGLQLKGIVGKRYFRRISGVIEELGKRYGG